MAVRTRFSKRIPIVPTGRRQTGQIIRDMRGLNSTDPYGILKSYASPYNRNARMYVPEQDRQVAISTRTGAKSYSVPVGETKTGYVNPITVIDNLDSITGWTVFQGTLTLNTTDEIEGTGCANVAVTSSVNSSNIDRLNATAIDLSSTKGKVIIPVYLSTPSTGTFSYVRLTIGSDANLNNNNTYWNLTTQQDGSAVVYDAWNYFAVDLASAPTTTIGTPVRTAIKSIRVSVHGTSYQMTWRVDNITTDIRLNTLESFDYLLGWASNYTLSRETTNQLEGMACAKLVMTTALDYVLLQKLNSPISINLSSTAGTIVVPVYIPTPTSGNPSIFRLRIGSDATLSTNNCRWDVTTQADGSPITYDTWNYFAIDLSTAPTSTTGSPNRSSIISWLVALVDDTNFQLNGVLVDRITLDPTFGLPDKNVDFLNAYAQPFTVSSSGVLTKLDVYVKKVTGSSPLTVKIYSDSSGNPGTLLATSTIAYTDIQTNYDYFSVKFIEAPSLTTLTTYWYTLSVADDTGTTYRASSNVATTGAKSSVNGGLNWTSTNYTFYYKAYTSTSGGVKGLSRYYPSTGSPVTFFAHGTNIYSVDDNTGAVTSQKSGLNSNSTYVRFAQFDDAIFSVNGYDAMQRSTGTTFSSVGAAPFNPINVIVYELKLFIIDSTNKNLIRYSDEMDYTVWDAANYIYVPESKYSDPITGWIVFQNNLIVFTKNSKHIIYPSGTENFAVRQALGTKGAVSQEAIATDGNYVYFISGDNKLYRWNGSSDEELSRVIESDFDDIANIDNARLNYHDGKLYYWFQQSGGSVYNRNFVYEIEYKEWFYDTNRYINGGFELKRDNNRFLLSSDRAGVIYENTDEWSDVGRPIEFEYHTNYFDLGSPDAIKRVRRLYFHLQKTDWSGNVQVGSDVDFADQPDYNNISVKSEGVGGVWGTFVWGTGTWATKDIYKRYRTTVPGTATYYQARIKRTGANTPVYFIGHSMYYRNRRPS